MCPPLLNSFSSWSLKAGLAKLLRGRLGVQQGNVARCSGGSTSGPGQELRINQELEAPTGRPFAGRSRHPRPCSPFLPPTLGGLLHLGLFVTQLLHEDLRGGEGVPITHSELGNWVPWL